MTEIAVTGAASQSSAEAFLKILEKKNDRDIGVRLFDNAEYSGLSRRVLGRTVTIEPESELVGSSSTLILDFSGTYIGEAEVLIVPNPAELAILKIIEHLGDDSTKLFFGSIKLPVSIVNGGVAGLVSQITQLLSGKSPNLSPFGSRIAFNSKLLDSTKLENLLKKNPLLINSKVAIELSLSDLFHTIQMSLWIQAGIEALDDLMKCSSGCFESGLEASPISLDHEVPTDPEIRMKRIDKFIVQIWFACDVDHAILAPYALEWLEKKIMERLH